MLGRTKKYKIGYTPVSKHDNTLRYKECYSINELGHCLKYMESSGVSIDELWVEENHYLKNGAKMGPMRSHADRLCKQYAEKG